jgi:hypothetical protein
MRSAGTGRSFVGDRCRFCLGAGGHGTHFLDARLVLTLAVALLLSAFLAGCGGFFIRPTLSVVYVQPAAATIAVGNDVQLFVYARYSDGSTGQISRSKATWSSSASTIATVTSPGGLVTGVSVGTTTVTGSFAGMTATASITVSADN